MFFLVPSWFIWIGVALTAIAVGIGLMLLFAAVGAALAGVAMIFSRLSFGLLVAFLLSQNNALMGMTGWSNFLAWAAIVLVITFLLCKFPRISMATQFMATLLICYLVMALCVGIVMSIITAFTGGSFSFAAGYNLTILAISLLFAGFAVLREAGNADSTNNIQLKNKVMVNIERLVASAIYGLVLMLIVVLCLNNVVAVPVAAQWGMLAGFAVAAFVIDLILPHTPIMSKIKKVSVAVAKPPVTKEVSRSSMIEKLK